MSNWFTNVLSVENGSVEAVFDRFTTLDEKGERHVNFNAFVQMPIQKRLYDYIEEVTAGLSLFLTAMNPFAAHFVTKYEKHRFSPPEFESVVEMLQKKTPFMSWSPLSSVKEVEEYKSVLMLNQGIRCDSDLCPKLVYRDSGEFDPVLFGGHIARLIAVFGISCHFDWAMEHWGVPGNAQSQYVCPEYLEFDSPDRAVTPMILQLSTFYPELTFKYEYSSPVHGRTPTFHSLGTAASSLHQAQNHFPKKRMR